MNFNLSIQSSKYSVSKANSTESFEERFNALFIAFFALINALRVSALLSTVIAEVLCVAVKDC